MSTPEKIIKLKQIIKELEKIFQNITKTDKKNKKILETIENKIYKQEIKVLKIKK